MSENFGEKAKDFFRSPVGGYIIIVLCFAVIWGITLALWLSETGVASVVVLICAIFGWKSLNQIQPVMFLWLSFVGWIIYFVVKFILAALVGLFVTPWMLGKKIGLMIYGSL